MALYGLIGYTVGDEVLLELKFPEDYGTEKLAGKDVRFKVTIKSFTRKTYPDFNDDNVAKYTDKKTVAEYTESVRDDIIQGLLWNELFEVCKVKQYPEKELKQYYDNYIDSYTNTAAQLGYSANNMFSLFGYSDAKSFFQAMINSAKSNVKQELIILGILEVEPSLELSEEAFEAEVKKLYDEAVENGSFDEDYKHFKKHYDDMTLKLSVYGEKVIELVQKNMVEFDDITMNGFYTNRYGTRYYINGELQKGWMEIEVDGTKALYYFDEKDGYSPALCTYIKHKDADKEMWHQFDKQGKYIGLYNGSYIDENGTRYFEEGVLVTGWRDDLNLDGKEDTADKYYFDKEDGYMYVGYKEVDGKWNKFDKNGQWIELAGDGLKVEGENTLYFKDSVLQTGWQQVDLNDDGTADKCYFDPNNNGYMVVKDACKIDDVWYYFDDKGIHQGKASGLVVNSLGKRYFEEGVLVTGHKEVTLDGKANEYYFDPDNDGYCLISEWLKEKDPEDESKDTMKFYYDGNGHKVKGKELTIDGTTYVFAADGTWTVKGK